VAAEYSGLSVDNLLHAVYRLEQKIIYWQRADKQGIKMDGMEGVEDGVGSRYLARMGVGSSNSEVLVCHLVSGRRQFASKSASRTYVCVKDSLAPELCKSDPRTRIT
jgi:hypothetical protein